MSHGEPDDLWVFAYGSLMWNPGFRWAEAVPARLDGYARRLCVYSVLYRGSIARPGLVLGLDRGGVTEGLAYRIPAIQANEVHARLTARELIYRVYREKVVAVHLRDGRGVWALAYVAERAHPSYAGRITDEARIRIVRAARGRAGTNLAYLASTIQHLSDLSIRDRQLERLAVRIGGFACKRRGSGEVDDVSRTLSISRSAWVRGPGTAPLRGCARRHFNYRQNLASK